MTDKELKKLSRSELLEIILMLQQNQEKLISENNTLKAELDRRATMVRSNTSFGEVAVQLDNAMKEFKFAADRYILRLEKEAAYIIESKGNDYGE